MIPLRDFLMDSFYDISKKKIEFFSQLNFHRSASFYSKLTPASWATLEFDLFENWFADSSTPFLRFIPP